MTAFTVGSIGDLSFSGMIPPHPITPVPRVALGGNVKESINLRIQVTTQGWADGVHAQVKWSNRGGAPGTWSPDIILHRADNPAEYGLSTIPLGNTGLTAYFTWGYYYSTYSWQASGSGGMQAQFTVGSYNGTMSAFGWGHNYPREGADPNIWEVKFAEPDRPDGLEKRWILQWANARTSMYFSSISSIAYLSYRGWVDVKWVAMEDASRSTLTNASEQIVNALNNTVCIVRRLSIHHI
jgi:hypothetical protein